MSHKPETLPHVMKRFDKVREQRDRLLALCERALRALDEDNFPQLRDDLREAIDQAKDQL